MARKAEKKRVEIGLDEFRSRVRSADLNTFFILGAVILVLGIGLFALFSPTARNLRRGNPACGKIVIAADGPSLKANVSPTLSGARYFLVINPLSKNLLESAKNPYAKVDNPGPNVAYFIAGKGEEAVIAGSVGRQCYGVLTQFGIKAFGGFNGKVRDAISIYRQARISQGSSVMYGGGSPVGATQVAFGFGKHAFICPACNWRLRCQQRGNTYPSCPNCGGLMATDMSNRRWRNWQEWIPFATVADTVPVQNNTGWTGTQPNFWQGRDSNKFFICPSCNWRMYAQRDTGHFPRCPNCRALMARGGASGIQAAPSGPVANTIPVRNNTDWAQLQPNFWQGPDSTGFLVCPNCKWSRYAQRDIGQFPRCPNCKALMARGDAPGVQAAPSVNNAVPARPIYPDAMMPHGYRGVCSNCHQILRGSQAGANSQNTGTTQAGRSPYNAGGTCILR